MLAREARAVTGGWPQSGRTHPRHRRRPEPREEALRHEALLSLAVVVAVATVSDGAAASAGADLVTGRGLVTRSAGAEHRWGFAAREDPAGVGGHLELVVGGGADAGQLHGSIVCAGVDPATGTARLAARVERSTTPLAPEGSFLVWTVVDRGEAAWAPPDRTSELVPVADPAVATGHCGVGLLPLTAVERGSVWVRR